MGRVQHKVHNHAISLSVKISMMTVIAKVEEQPQGILLDGGVKMTAYVTDPCMFMQPH